MVVEPKGLPGGPLKPGRITGEALLRRRLLPCQLEDWEKNSAFNVRGKGGRLWRIYGMNMDRSCVKLDGNARNVWPSTPDVRHDPALNAYTLMCMVRMFNDQEIAAFACQSRMSWNQEKPHNYGGAI
jgi:hypothetical protein